jgi:hypothetical protein
MATCQQRPVQIPCPTKPTMTVPDMLDQPLNNGHFLGVPRVAVVQGFDCILLHHSTLDSLKFVAF